MAAQFNIDQLTESACKLTGLNTFDSETFQEGLEILLTDVGRIELSESFAEGFEGSVVQALARRLKVTAYLKSHTHLLDKPIERPVFVFGVPRTGTTLLNNLLAADPARRSSLAWEIDDPVPPPTSAELYNDPRALARLEQEREMLTSHPEAGKYYRGSAIYPFECLGFMQSDFKTLDWESRGRLPNYRDFVFSTDQTSSYAYHKKFLQVLQADAPGIWNLKMPSHALWIETLLKTYPDARLIWTHRDPITATGSFCSLIKKGHEIFAGHADLAWISENMPWQAAEHANRIMDARDRLGEERIIDVHYADMVRDPIGVMRKLYIALGDDLTAEAECGMQAWLDDNPQEKFGRHEYKLAQFGLTPHELRDRFERYLARYEVEPEG